MAKNNPELYSGKEKPKRGRTQMELCNPNNSQHLEALKILGVGNQNTESGRKHLLQYFELGNKLLLQFFEGKPTGYIKFCLEGNNHPYPDILHIYVKPEYRDTIPIPEERKSEVISKNEKEFDKIISNNQGKSIPDLPRRDQRAIRAYYRTTNGMMKRDNQLFLAAKMTRWLAKKYGEPPRTERARSPEGERYIKKYLTKYYNFKFFRNIGKHKPRPGRAVQNFTQKVKR